MFSCIFPLLAAQTCFLFLCLLFLLSFIVSVRTLLEGICISLSYLEVERMQAEQSLSTGTLRWGWLAGHSRAQTEQRQCGLGVAVTYLLSLTLLFHPKSQGCTPSSNPRPFAVGLGDARCRQTKAARAVSLNVRPG